VLVRALCHIARIPPSTHSASGKSKAATHLGNDTAARRTAGVSQQVHFAMKYSNAIPQLAGAASVVCVSPAACAQFLMAGRLLINREIKTRAASALSN